MNNLCSPTRDLVRSHVSRKCREAIAHAGLSPREVAELMGVHERLVYSWCSGERFPSFEKLLGLAALCDKSVAWLFGELDDLLDQFHPANRSAK